MLCDPIESSMCWVFLLSDERVLPVLAKSIQSTTVSTTLILPLLLGLLACLDVWTISWHENFGVLVQILWYAYCWLQPSSSALILSLPLGLSLAYLDIWRFFWNGNFGVLVFKLNGIHCEICCWLAAFVVRLPCSSTGPSVAFEDLQSYARHIVRGSRLPLYSHKRLDPEPWKTVLYRCLQSNSAIRLADECHIVRDISLRNSTGVQYV